MPHSPSHALAEPLIDVRPDVVRGQTFEPNATTTAEAVPRQNSAPVAEQDLSDPSASDTIVISSRIVCYLGPHSLICAIPMNNYLLMHQMSESSKLSRWIEGTITIPLTRLVQTIGMDNVK